MSVVLWGSPVSYGTYIISARKYALCFPLAPNIGGKNRGWMTRRSQRGIHQRYLWHARIFFIKSTLTFLSEECAIYSLHCTSHSSCNKLTKLIVLKGIPIILFPAKVQGPVKVDGDGHWPDLPIFSPLLAAPPFPPPQRVKNSQRGVNPRRGPLSFVSLVAHQWGWRSHFYLGGFGRVRGEERGPEGKNKTLMDK